MPATVRALLPLLLLGGCLPGADGPGPRRYLAARDGSQCLLQEGAARHAEAEVARLGLAEIHVEQAQVSALLRPDAIDPGCLPEVQGLWWQLNEHAMGSAAMGAAAAGKATCEACGCPETWFYCVVTHAPPRVMKAQGYAAVW